MNSGSDVEDAPNPHNIKPSRAVGVDVPSGSGSPVAEPCARLTLLPESVSSSSEGDADANAVPEPATHRFQPIEELGTGGVGQVIAVRDRDIGRRVAIKRMREDRRSPGATARFVQEVRTVGRLEHPNIVTVHDVGRDQTGNYYFVMKLVDGETLEAVISRLRAGDQEAHSSWTFERRMDVVYQVACAIRFAHDQGIIHRDLKPANIMVGKHGEVTVVDWGLAKPIDEAPTAMDAESSTWIEVGTSSTRVGAIIGTPRYMAPEQGRGDPATLATDIWALSLLLYEFISLRHYLDGIEVMDLLLEAIAHRKIVPPAHLSRYPAQGPVPADISWIVMSGLERDPDRRPTIEALIHRLDRRRAGDIDGQCIVTWQKRWLLRLTRFVDHHPVLALGGFAGGVLGLLLLSLAAVGGLFVGVVGLLV